MDATKQLPVLDLHWTKN